MHRFIRGGNAVRLVVLLVVAAVAVSWHRLDTSDPASSSSASSDAPPAEQLLAEGATLVPAAEPLPAVTPSRGSKRAKHTRHSHRRGHGTHRQHRKHLNARHASAGKHGSHHARHRRGAGRDIGWPQCPRDVGFRGRNGLGQPMPDPGVKFVIVGLTNGRAFTPNPCLDRHLDWVRSHHVRAAAYAFATYPTRAQLRRYRHSGPYDGRRFLGALGNAGHAAARYNIRVMQRHGFTTPHVWLDVEPSSSRPWSGRRTWNGAVVRGWVRAYREAGYTVGFYSTTSLWNDILGRLRFGLPEWRTAGPVSPRTALRRCHERGFQGGPAVIAQWWTAHRDFDRLCPGPSRSETLSRYFQQW